METISKYYIIGKEELYLNQTADNKTGRHRFGKLLNCILLDYKIWEAYKRQNLKNCINCEELELELERCKGAYKTRIDWGPKWLHIYKR